MIRNLKLLKFEKRREEVRSTGQGLRLLPFLIFLGALPLNAQNKDSKKVVPQEDVLHLSGFEPLYFVYGNPTTKVKISFKYKLVENYPVYIGYNQLVFWDIGKDSNPFRDATYSPELFYRWTRPNPAAFVRSVDFIPFWHMSNGKRAEDSRSLDRFAVQVNSTPLVQVPKFKLSLRVSGPPLNQDPTNTDYIDYVGPAEFRIAYSDIALGPLTENEISLRYFTGGKWGQHLKRGGREVGLSFRLKFIYLTPSFYVQYFEGRGESLLNYRDNVRNFRVGFKL